MPWPGAPRIWLLNVTRPPTDDVRVRQAINYAVDKEAFLATVYKGTGLKATAPLTAVMLDDPALRSAYPFNPGKAKELLGQAGWQPGADGIRQKGGQRLEVVLNAIEYGGGADPTAQLIQASLREVGMDVKIKAQARPPFYEDNYRCTTHGPVMFLRAIDPDAPLLALSLLAGRAATSTGPVTRARRRTSCWSRGGRSDPAGGAQSTWISTAAPGRGGLRPARGRARGLGVSLQRPGDQVQLQRLPGAGGRVHASSRRTSGREAGGAPWLYLGRAAGCSPWAGPRPSRSWRDPRRLQHAVPRAGRPGQDDARRVRDQPRPGRPHAGAAPPRRAPPPAVRPVRLERGTGDSGRPSAAAGR